MTPELSLVEAGLVGRREVEVLIGFVLYKMHV